MFLKDKYLASGVLERFKARLVAGGYQQDKGLYQDLSSPTAATSSVLSIAALAASEGRKVVGNSENEPSTKRSIDEIRTWKFARLLLFLGLSQEDGYINGNLLIEYEPCTAAGERARASDERGHGAS